MAPYSRWVHASFKQTLLDSCDDYMETNDRGTDKSRSKLITRVAKEITDIAADKLETIPNDLEKSVRTWFSNYASGHTKEERPAKSKVDTRGHPISTKAWTAKSVCKHIFADRISDEQKRLSDDREKDIGKYHPALASIFEALSPAELKRCEDAAAEWNTKGLPDEMQRKLSKTIPTEVTDFFKFIKHRTGAVFIAFAAYTNEDGEQTYARYESEDLNFFGSRKEHQKGPNNIVSLWKDFILEAAEEADSHEALEVDDEYYPQLPANVLQLRLRRRKAVVRQFMAAARRFYKLTGRIPWLDIAENPSHHLSKRSRPDSDYRLEEPSHMKSDGVDAWLKHWLRLQRKDKRPLVLKDRSDRPSTPSKQRGKGKGKGKARDTESEESDDEQKVDTEDDSESNMDKPATAAEKAPVLPLSPKSAALSRKTRHAFLTSLSDDTNYQQMVLLLRAAKDGDLLEGTPPAWASWTSADNYLSDTFYDTESSSSLSAFIRWADMDPITADNDMLASYKQVELVILSFGLAFRGLWIAQFPERYSDVPAHVVNSQYPFSQYEQLGHQIQDLISGYAETLQEIEAAYPARRLQQKKSTLEGTSKSVSRGKDVSGERQVVGQNVSGTKAKKPLDGTLQKRQHGLSGVPATLQPLREEIGLAGEAWATLGPAWQSLASLWLRAEACVSKSGRTDLTFNEIRKSSMPDEWKEWINAKLMKTDAQRPADTFGKVLTDYLSGLPSTALKVGGTVMTQIWCRPGKTGIVGLLLCLYWQAEYSGAGRDWKANVQRVECIFNAILAQPDLVGKGPNAVEAPAEKLGPPKNVTVVDSA